jgi:hypothetical protein
VTGASGPCLAPPTGAARLPGRPGGGGLPRDLPGWQDGCRLGGRSGSRVPRTCRGGRISGPAILQARPASLTRRVWRRDRDPSGVRAGEFGVRPSWRLRRSQRRHRARESGLEVQDHHLIGTHGDAAHPDGRRLGDSHLVGDGQQRSGDTIRVDQLVQMGSWELLDDSAPPRGLRWPARH